MRYSIIAERERQRERAERQRWMTLVEAIKYIRDKEHLDDYDALEDLFRAIVEGRVKTLTGDFSYEEDTISGYHQVAPNDLQGELKICLDGPGYIKLDSCLAKTKNRRTNKIEYPKIKIVAGPVVKLNFDNIDLYNPRPIPKVNDYDYWPLLVFRDDLQKWPFAPEEEPHQALSAPTQIPELTDKTLNHTNAPVNPNASPFSESLITRSQHRRDAAKEAITAIWGQNGLPAGIMAPQRDEAINKWLKERGREPVSSKTIRRAFTELGGRT